MSPEESRKLRRSLVLLASNMHINEKEKMGKLNFYNNTTLYKIYRGK